MKTGDIFGLSHAFAPTRPPQRPQSKASCPATPLVASKVGGGCKLFAYRSPALKRQTHLGPFVSVVLEATPDTYNPHNVNVSDAGFMTQTDAQLGRC